MAAHWLDRLALRAARVQRIAATPPALAAAAPLAAGLSRRDLVGRGATETSQRLPLELTSIPVPPDRPFSRLVGVRALGLAAGLLVAAPLRTLGPSSAAAALVRDCEPTCMATSADLYRRRLIICNSGLPEPADFLFTGALFDNPLCRVIAYQRLVYERRICASDDCGRKQPPPPAPPPPKRGPPPTTPGGCGLIGLTSCGDTCCPQGSLCGASGCIPPPPPADECNPPCPPGKTCKNGQCVDVSSPCGTCPPGAKCCSCSFGAYCAAADFECRC